MNRQKTEIPATLAFLTMFCLPIATAQITETKLIASDGAVSDGFGGSVSLSGDYALVGATGDEDNGASSGSAYIFHYEEPNWVEQGKLLASDGAELDVFGGSVSLSGDYALVGARYDDDNGPLAGSAYIFHYDGSNWIEQAKLIASDGADGDNFGSEVSLSGDYALVGAQFDDDNGTNAGSAYIFHYDGSNWLEEAKLIASDGAAYDYFGLSVSLSGDYALVGAYFNDDSGTNSGSAYVFHYNGSNWTEETKLIASDGAADDYFGFSVSLSGDYALVGAFGDDDNGTKSGSAYIFHYDGSNWVEQTKLIAGDGAAVDHFGWSVSFSGDYALVGAFGDDSLAGSAYIFHYDGSNWIEQTKLIASDGAADDHFGSSVSLSGDKALVGAYGDGDDKGAAYVYAGFATSAPSIPCDSIFFFNAKCNMSGAAQAMVKMTGDWSSETVTFDLDGVDQVSTVMSNGTNSIAKMTVPHAGYGSHTVTLEDPAGCYSPVTFNCQVDAPPDPEWDALWAEYEALEHDQALKVLPAETRLIGNYPNPFNPVTTFRYGLSEPGRVSLKVYNMLGQLVRTIVDEQQVEGYHEALWDGRNEVGVTAASGIYVYRMTAGSFVETKRMMLIK